MEFIRFETIVGYIAAFGSFCLAVSLMGHLRRDRLRLSTAFVMFAVSIILGLVSYVRPFNISLNLLSKAFPYALLVFTYLYSQWHFASTRLSIRDQFVNLIFIFIFSAVTMRVLYIGGVVLGPNSDILGLIFAISLCSLSLHVQLLASLKTSQISIDKTEPARPIVQQ